jgi:hypothetical protein
MAKYSKKPVVIEAVQFTGFNFDEIEAFVGGDYGKDAEGNQVIATLEGALTISNNDFIIKGIGGEVYPCKPDIFKACYKEEDANSQINKL